MRHTLIPRRSMIGSFVGNMFTSQPDDIKKTRRNFATIGRYDGDTELEYIDRGLDQTIRTFQIDKGLKQDGVMRPNGETENALNRDLQNFSNNDLKNAFDVKPALELSDNVGNLQRNKPEDVKQVQKELSSIKLLPESVIRNPSGILDGQTDQAIKAFQSIKGLRVDGMLSPRGETAQMFDSTLSSENNDDTPIPDSDGEKLDEPPIPPRKPEPPEDDEPEEKPDCEDLEIAWVNAEAELFIAQQNLESAQEEKQSLEQELEDNKTNLTELNAVMNKERKEKNKAKIIGAGTGAPIGAFLGSPGGPGSSLALGGIGLGVGGFIGRVKEEIEDAIDPNSKTDLTLGFEKQALLKNIKKIEAKIQKVLSHINTVLKPEYDIKNNNAQKAKESFRECMAKIKKDNKK